VTAPVGALERSGAVVALHRDDSVVIASGRQTRSEELGFGDEEFAPWQLGAVM
jgi:altronate dehydratase